MKHKIACWVSLGFALIFAFNSGASASTKYQKKSRSIAKRPGKARIKAPFTTRGAILFRRGYDLCLVDPVTRRQKVLTKGLFRSVMEGSPVTAVSPDGDFLLYEGYDRERDHVEIWSIRFDGTNAKRLTYTKRDGAGNPQFSPDGRQILYLHTNPYYGQRGFSASEIRVMNADGTNNRHVLGDIADTNNYYLAAYWSSNGKRILYNKYPGMIDYYAEDPHDPIMESCNLDGTQVEAFHDNYQQFEVPFVSPDRRWMLRRSSEIIPLSSTSGGTAIFSPAPYSYLQSVNDMHWSPDSKSVAFTASQTCSRMTAYRKAQSVYPKQIWVADIEKPHHLLTLVSIPDETKIILQVLAWLPKEPQLPRRK